MLTRGFIKAASVAVTIFWAVQAHSVPIVQGLSIGTSRALVGAPSLGSPVAYQLFDESLGTLDYVGVRIVGSWQAAGSLQCLCVHAPGPFLGPFLFASQFEQASMVAGREAIWISSFPRPFTSA